MLGAPELLRAVMSCLGLYAVATTASGAEPAGAGHSGRGKSTGRWLRWRRGGRRGGGAAAGAVRPPAVLCWNQSQPLRDSEFAIAAALVEAVEALGWTAVEGWEGWRRGGGQGVAVDGPPPDEGSVGWADWRLWIVDAANMPPSESEVRVVAGDSLSRPGSGPATAAGAAAAIRGDVAAAARCAARRRTARPVRAFKRFDDLAIDCLDPAGSESAAGGRAAARASRGGCCRSCPGGARAAIMGQKCPRRHCC